MANPFANIESVTVSVSRSSLISEVRWTRNNPGITKDPTGNLVLTFKGDEERNGERYEYISVPSTILQGMLVAKSIGKFFHEHIVHNYVTYKGV